MINEMVIATIQNMAPLALLWERLRTWWRGGSCTGREPDGPVPHPGLAS